VEGEGKRGGNVEYHHLLLSNLTTGSKAQKCIITLDKHDKIICREKAVRVCKSVMRYTACIDCILLPLDVNSCRTL